MFRAVSTPSLRRVYRSRAVASAVRAARTLPAAVNAASCPSDPHALGCVSHRLCHNGVSSRVETSSRHRRADSTRNVPWWRALSLRRPACRGLHTAAPAWASARTDGGGSGSGTNSGTGRDGGAAGESGAGSGGASTAGAGGSGHGTGSDSLEDESEGAPGQSTGPGDGDGDARVVSTTDYETVWSIPNMITMGRIVAAPVLAGLVVYEQYPVAVVGACDAAPHRARH